MLATAGLVLTGCSGEDVAERLAEEAAEQAGGGEVDIDTDDGSVSIESDDGSTVGFQATHDGAFDDAKAFFDAELEAAGWTITNSTTSDTSGLRSASWQVEGFGHEGLVTVTQLREDGGDDTVTSISANLESTGDAGS